MKKKEKKEQKKIDLISILLIITIVCIILWIGYTVYGHIRFSQDIRHENQEVAELKEDFAELRIINPDVIAWLEIDNTNIDFPVVQTSNNVKYLTKSVYGEPAAYGAIFLDYRNDPRFADSFSLIYGHHMRDGNMFGDLDRFDDNGFFVNNSGGVLTTPQNIYRARCLAFMIIPESTKYIYDPTSWNGDNVVKYLETVKKNSKCVNQEEMSKLETAGSPYDIRLLALSTCTSYDKSLRYVLILNLEEQI